MHSVFMNFPLFQPVHDQIGSVYSLSLHKGRNREGRENKSCLLLLQLGVKGTSGLRMEGSGGCVTFPCLAKFNDGTKILLSWENHYFYEVLLRVCLK